MNELSLCACVLGQGGHCVCSLSEWMGSQLYDISQEHLLSAMGKSSKRRDVFNKQHSTMQTTMILKKTRGPPASSASAENVFRLSRQDFVLIQRKG